MRERWLAVWVGLWLCTLPIRLRVYALPVLLQRLSCGRGRGRRRSLLEMEQAVRLVVRICQLRFFRCRLFPRGCLRRALTLYYVLTRLGYPARIHIGVRKRGGRLEGHSWVTLEGKAVADRTPPAAFRAIYSFPSTPSTAE